MQCPKCSSDNIDTNKFCGNCGQKLLATKSPVQTETSIGGERKHATVMFSDLSAYTSMTEKLDPEEVKRLMGDIFKQAETIVNKYQGTVERFFGDEIMILFGVPKSHEDDPIRAIHTALEIHKLVEELSSDFEKNHHTPLNMHTGINTGLVITGDEYIGKGRHGLTGDTINLAKRMTSLAQPGEIIIGQNTQKLTTSQFSLKTLDPIQVKGKQDPINTYLVQEAKRKTLETIKQQGVRAELIGRKKELTLFKKKVDRLEKGFGSVNCLYGYAGTGKSRLVEEYRLSTNVQWFEGCSYPYTQGTPYFPLLTLFDDIFGIKEEDTQEIIKVKIEKNVQSLIPDDEDIVPYIGSLYSLSYPEVETVSPEFWKSKLFDTVLQILRAIAGNQPTVICIEDLHWADPSFLELIHFIHKNSKLPILFLYVSRPVITIFKDDQINGMTELYQEIRLEDLSSLDAQIMLVSLLKSKDIPTGLKRFVETKTQGNPFYLEEMINSLIESKVLIKHNDQWHLDREITDTDISSSIHGVISARIDRLETQSKRILQEAAVIGRSFYFEIINRITNIKKDINSCLNTLEGFNLIKPGKSNIDIEYMFKHALTQEVVYNGLLKTERQVIHEKIGQVMEQIFSDRLPEFYETLAHHYARGKSVYKAVDYLIKSGEKSIRRYAIGESHGYFQQAYDLMKSLGETSTKNCEIKLDLVTRWALVFYYDGNYKMMDELLRANEHLIPSIDNKEILGMFLNWQGNAIWVRGEYLNAKENLLKAYKIGKEINSKRIIGYTATWLSWVYADFGMYDKGIEFAKIAIDISKEMKDDHYLYYKPMAGIGLNYFWSGYGKGGIDTGNLLIEYGNKHSQVRSHGMGYCFKGGGYFNTGDIDRAISLSEKAVFVAGDPFYNLGFQVILAISYLQNDDMKKAKEVSKGAIEFSNKFGCELFGDLHQLVFGVALIDEGQMTKGYNLLKLYERRFKNQQRKSALLTARLLLGKVFSQIALKKKSVPPLIMLKNMGFILRHVPTAEKTAINYFTKAIRLGDEIKAVGMAAQAHLELGILHKEKNRTQEAKHHLKTAISIFESIHSDVYLKHTQKELYSLT